MGQAREAEEWVLGETLLRSHVERCLQDVWGTRDLVTDCDGDHPFRRGTAAGWVSARGPNRVSVFAHAARGLRRTAALLEEVSDLNAASTWAKVTLREDILLVEAELPAAAVNRLALEHAVTAVGTVADEVGQVIVAVFGGETPFARQDAQETSPEELF